MISDRKLARVKNVADLPIVEVIWRDATSFHGWDTLEGARKDTPDECRVVGRLVQNNRKYVSVVQGVISSTGKMCENWVIPRPWVLKVATVKNTGRRRAKRKR